MNERIKELVVQSGLKVESWMTNPPKPFQILGSAEEFEKFAELIVKECIEQAELEEDRFTGLDAIDLAHAMQNFQNLLKQHFGVK